MKEYVAQELLEAARAYYTGYCQDEADGSFWICGDDQRKAAQRLRDAIQHAELSIAPNGPQTALDSAAAQPQPVLSGLPSEADINGARNTRLTVTPNTEGVKWLGCVYGEDDDWRIYAVPIRIEQAVQPSAVDAECVDIGDIIAALPPERQAKIAKRVEELTIARKSASACTCGELPHRPECPVPRFVDQVNGELLVPTYHARVYNNCPWCGDQGKVWSMQAQQWQPCECVTADKS